MKNRAFFAAAFVTFGVVLGAMMSGAFSGSERPPENCSDTKRAEKHAQENSPAVVNECRSDEGRTADYTLDLTIVTGFLVLVALGQMIMFGVQLRYMRQGMDDAKEVAGAAKLSAKAAIASLERPWLFMNKPVHNSNVWIAGDSALGGVFSLTNYGKAPAIILSIKGVVFLSPGPKNTLAEIGLDDTIVPTIIEFPGSDNLRAFKRKMGRHPRDVDSSVPFRGRIGGIDVPIHKIDTTGYITPIVVGGGESSPAYWVVGQMPFAQTPTGIPIEAAMNIYFIGDVLYHGPDETIHTLSFCYESLPGGSFKPLFGAPYNERRTAQE